MTRENENDKKSRRDGLIATIAFHGAIALVLILLVAWKAPNPPLPEYGIEINLGFADSGTGVIQPQTEVGNEGLSEETTAQPEPTQPQEQSAEENNTTPQEEVVTDETNPVNVKEESKEVKEEVKKETPKEVKPTPKEEKKVVKEEAIYTPKETADKTAEQKKGENLSQGDDKNAAGDKGKPTGTLDPNASFSGLQGGGAGGSGDGLDLAGWTWDRKPNPVFPGDERGTIVYTIEVDQDGQITKLIPDRILSPETDRICRNEIRKITFTPTGSNPPAVSRGKITIVVTAK